MVCSVCLEVNVPRSVQSVQYIYERSMCRYVRSNSSNIPYVPRPSFIAPLFPLGCKNALTSNFILIMSFGIIFRLPFEPKFVKR